MCLHGLSPGSTYRHELAYSWTRDRGMNNTHQLNDRGIMTTELLDLNDLASMLGRSPETIKKDMLRNHLAVPPRLHIPGTRLLRWRRVDVEVWLASHVEARDAVRTSSQQRKATSK